MSKIKDAINNIELPMEFKRKYDSGLINDEGYDLSLLNDKEIDYFRMFYPTSGVLFLSSEPGLAKTSITKNIAKKIKKVEIIRFDDGTIDFNSSGKMIGDGLYYIDLRLSLLDETDVGLYPNKVIMEVIENQESVKKAFLEHIVPVWAYKANVRPEKKGLPYCGTLIHFEELNRAPLSVRNAALQLLLERCIGFEFEFNDDVFMMSSGNLGDEDGTDVEEFDSALNGRLIHIKHTMNYKEWIEYYADEHVHKSIVNFILTHPSYYYIGFKNRDGKDKSYANPRSWTFLSDFIIKNFGKDSDPKKWISTVMRLGYGYVGSANLEFCRYINDILKLNIDMILNDYPNIKKQNPTLSRDKKSELLFELKSLSVSSLTDDQIENMKLFLLDLDKDETASYIVHIVDNDVIDGISNVVQPSKLLISFLHDKRFVIHLDAISKCLEE
jgi:hypothetical protein